MRYVKLGVFLLFCVPLAFAWDMVYLIVKMLYDGMSVVDKKGGDVLEKLRIMLWENS